MSLNDDAQHLRYSTGEMLVNDPGSIANVVAEMSSLVQSLAVYVERLEEARHNHDEWEVNLELADAMADAENFPDWRVES